MLRQQPVTRMPSLHFLRVRVADLQQKEGGCSTGIDPTKVYYIINPGDDLRNTQNRFQEWFSRSVRNKQYFISILGK